AAKGAGFRWHRRCWIRGPPRDAAPRGGTMADETPAAEGEAKAAGAEEAKSEAAGKGKGKLLVIIVGVVVLLAGGAGAAWLLGFLGHGKSAEAKQEVKDAPPTVGALLALDPFVANLADEDGKRYLKATLQLEFFEAKVPEEVNQRMPQIRDLLLTLFTSKLFTEIRT